MLLAALAALAPAPSAQPQVCDISGGFTITQSAVRADPGDSVEVSYTFGNSGTVACPELAVGYFLSTDRDRSDDDVLLGTGTLPATQPQTNAGSSGTVVVPEGTSRGGYRVLVVADYTGEVDELSEGNNTNSGDLTVGGDANGPNLAITNAELEETTAAPGDRVSFDYTVENRGQADVGDVTIGFYLRPINAPRSEWIPLGSEVVGNVEAGESEDESEQVTIPATVAPAQYALLVVADDDNAIEESDETDNVGGAGILTVTGATDISDGAGAGALALSASPNPSRGAVTLAYTLAAPSAVRLTVTDVLGREVAVVEGARGAGPHAETVDVSRLAPGVYVARVTAGAETAARTVTVAR